MSIYEGLVLSKSEKGVYTLVFDLQGEKVNKLSRRVMESLSTAIDAVASDLAASALVIRSGKPDIFIAGADIAEIQNLKTTQESLAVSVLGQSIFNKISKLTIPTIAAISGVCLGGGFELALACQFRVVSDSDRTQLGLPEVNLGIIPGWGGTQRLTRLIGLQKSLDIILSCRSVDGAKAVKLGMADVLVSHAFFESAVERFVTGILDPTIRKRLVKKRPKPGFLETLPLGPFFIAHLAKKEVTKKTKGFYPAPYAAIKACLAVYSSTLERGLAKEAALFSALPLTTVSKSLVQLFFVQDQLKKYSGISNGSGVAMPVNYAGVLGAGLMGSGIAWLFASTDIEVKMKDVDWAPLGKGLGAIKKMFDPLVKRRKLTENQAMMKFQRVSPTVSFDGFYGQDIVVEAVIENLDIKKQVFQHLETHVRPDTILATNTSSLSVTEMATVLVRPERFVGLHFFSPVNRMPLVEVIRGEKTSDDTVATVVALSKRLRKTPIVVKNCPGFLVNRILIPYVNEAVHCLVDGADILQVDRVAEKFGMPLGPLSLADEVGLDVGFKVAKILEEGYGERMVPSAALERLYADETLRGKKTGKGFYDHLSSGKTVNSKAMEVITSVRSSKARRLSDEDVLDRLMLIMVNEAARCLDELVVQHVEHLDMAMILGTGFPPFRGGICAYADARGLQHCVNRLTVLSDLYGSRFKPALYLQKLADADKHFYSKKEG